MKNLAEFGDDLNRLDRPDAKDGEDARLRDLRKLREELRRMQDEEGPSEQEQIWAWTRLSSQMSPSKPRWSLWYGLSTALAVLTLIGVIAVVEMNRGPEATQESLTTVAKSDEGISTGPVYRTIQGRPELSVTHMRPQISVVPFHSEPAKADVIWATGYQYLSASYEVK